MCGKYSNTPEQGYQTDLTFFLFYYKIKVWFNEKSEYNCEITASSKNC